MLIRKAISRIHYFNLLNHTSIAMVTVSKLHQYSNKLAMPLIVKDFKWQQSKTHITIQVPLHGIHQSKVDIFTCPEYIKASFEQYFFEVFLLHKIKTVDSSCTLTDTEIIIELLKCEELNWETLEIDIAKSEKLHLKQRLIQEEHERYQNDLKEKQSRKYELKRVAVRQQISLDTKQREAIEQIRNEEKQNALGDLKQWHPKQIVELSSDEDEKPQKQIVKKSVKRQPYYTKPKIEPNIPVPLPRKPNTLEVDFTPRQFPTPSRESQEEEEKEWLKKQTEVRRSVGFVSEDLRPEEKNPQYLKSKGDEFLKAGNYLAAISAYSFGIKLSEKFVDLYVGRSQAQFEQGNYYKCIQDCSTAIEMFKPAVPANLHLRSTCVARRGMSLCKMGLFKEGFSELEAAIKLEPYNDNFKVMLHSCREMASAESTNNA